MTVDEGCEYFENISNIKTKLLTLKKVGLGISKLDNRQRHYQVVRLKELNLQKNYLEDLLVEQCIF